MKTILFLSFALAYSILSFSQVIINEIDVDTPGDDTAEFVELYAPSSTSLDGYLLVFFNGSSETSYRTIDLAGSTISDGYFVIGNVATPNVDIEFSNNGLQNGTDAVALYQAAVLDFPNGSPVTTEGLVDAVVYDTNDDDIPGLLALLSAGDCQVQLNESSNGNNPEESSARIPDGGTALCPDTFIQQVPTPGATNVPACFGGTLEFSDTSTEMEICLDSEVPVTIQYMNSNTTGDGTLFVITDTDDIIISTTTMTEIDGTSFLEGTCRIHVIAYNGTLNVETLSEGEDAIDIATDGDCLFFGTNFITVNKIICNPDCDGGEVSSDAGEEVIVCLDDTEDVLTFSNNSLSSDDTYAYVITDEENFIIAILGGDSNDFNAAEAGVCRVWGLSYQGTLDPTTIEAGDPVFGVQTDGICLELSDNFIQVTRQECIEVEGCSDLFFSEYQEGSGQNKALEIYNPTQFPVLLADYQIVNCNNGCDVAGGWDFINDILGTASIAPGGVFIVTDPDAEAAILDLADVTHDFLSNGDDSYALQRKSTLEIIDIIGDTAIEDVGDGWTVSGVANGTQNHTLVRMTGVNEGTSDWSIGQDQWMVLDQNTFENLGDHEIIPCIVNTDPTISFSMSASTVQEDAGTVTVEVSILNPLDEEMTVDVILTGGTAVSPDDFDGTGFPVTLTFPAEMTDAQTFDVSIVDDMAEEMAETIIFELMNPSTGLTLGSSTYTLTIDESDVVIPVVDIIVAAEVDANGAAVNFDSTYELRGIVYGVNMRPAGLQFTLIDPTDGIGVFSFEPVDGYTVNEGDSIHVVGTVDQFSGLTQIAPSSIELISSDNTLKEPTVITELNEGTESDLVMIECVQVVDASQWDNDGSGFDVDITDGINTYTLRVDGDTDVFGTDAPTGSFDVTGLGGQFDDDSPYDSGYQIIPRYLEDLDILLAEYSITLDIDNGVEEVNLDAIEPRIVVSPFGATIEFVGGNPELTYSWVIEGVTYEGNSVTIGPDVTGSWAFNTISISVTVTDETCSSQQNYELFIDSYLSVNELEKSILIVYPNPTESTVTLEVPAQGSLQVFNNVGQLVTESKLVNPGTQNVDVEILPNGVYYIQLISEKTTFNGQFIKN